MGRARSRQHQSVGASAFTGVIGQARGSVVAQKQRDSEEERALEAAFVEFASAAGTQFPSVFGLVDILADAYREHSPVFTTADEIFERLTPFWFMRDLEEIVIMIKIGDPVNAPGFTAPLKIVLNRWFGRERSRHTHASTLCEHAGLVVSRLFGPEDEDEEGTPIYIERSPEFYQPWEQLLRELGAVLAEKPRTPSAQALGFKAVGAMRRAPGSVIAGAMQGWVQVFARLQAEDQITDGERRELGFLLDSHAAGSEAGRALASLRHPLD